MSGFGRIRRLWLVGLAWLGLLSPAVQAKGYRIPSIRIQAAVDTGGLLHVQEEITYLFDGRFRFAFREIPLKEGEEILAIQVWEGERAFRPADSEQPGTYRISGPSRRPRITWYYDARDEERSFRFHYTLAGVVKRYPDTAELYYKFVGEDWDRRIGEVSVRLRLPGQVTDPNVRAWAHGPLYGHVSLGNGEVMLEVRPLPPNTFWEGRILFPGQWVQQLPLWSSQPQLQRILEEEERWAVQANQRRQAALEAEARRQRLISAFTPLALAIPLLALGFWLFLYFRHGKPYSVEVRAVPGELPSQHPPALIRYLFQRSVDAPALTATLLDLARRGHLNIRETEVERDSWWGRRRESEYFFRRLSEEHDPLRPFEQSLLQYLFPDDSTLEESLSQLKQRIKAQSSTFRRWFREWQQEVVEEARQAAFFEPYPVGTIILNCLVGVGALATGILILVLTDTPWGMPPLVAGALQAVLSLSLSRRTRTGRALYLAWKGFKQHIRTIAKGLGPVRLEAGDWQRYLALAVVLGIQQELSRALQLSLPETAFQEVAWFSSSSRAGSFTHLSEGINSMASAFSTTMSSASGTGGGASGGGGGGSGGGGGGAG